MACPRKFAAWRLIGGALVLIVAVTVCILAASVASQTEGGWQMLRDHLIAGIPTVLHPGDYRDDEPRTREMKWLLVQAQHVADDPHATAADCMGAAQVLASIYGSREIPNPFSLGVAMWWPLPHPAVDRSANANLTARLIRQSRRLAERATQLEPNNTAWWRLRVLCRLFDDLRDESLLREADSHDPDNALYDYLLAANCFERAWDANADGDLFIAHPEALFDSMNFYLQAFTKPTLATGESASSCVAGFFKHSAGTAALKLAWHDPQDFDNARSMLLSRTESPFDSAKLDEFRTRRLQHPAANWFLQLNLTPNWINQWRHSGESSNEALAATLQYLSSRGLQLSSAEQQLMTYFAFWRSKQWGVRAREEFAKLGSVVGVAASSAACMLLLVAAICWLGGTVRRSRSNNENAARSDSKTDLSSFNSPSLGIVLPALVWIALFAATFGLLGLVPTFQPRLSDCHWSVWAAIAVVGAALVGLALWTSIRFLLSQNRLPRQQRAPHFQIVRWGLVLAASVVFVVVMQSLVDRHVRRWATTMLFEFPAHVVNETDNISLPPDGIAWLSGQVGVTNKTLVWSLVQWGVHGGLWFATIGWLSAIFLILWRRNEKLAARARAGTVAAERSAHVDEPSATMSIRRAFRQTYMRPIGKAALTLAFIFLLVSLAATTDWLNRLNQQYEQKIARLANTKWLAEEIESTGKAQAAALQLSPGK